MKLIECPRDAWQGVTTFIPTEEKIRYISSLLKVGFDTIDVGSFVSATAMPQVRDTAELLSGLDRTGSHTRLLVIAANERGAEAACRSGQVDAIGYPFSISETFQMRNANTTIAGSMERIRYIAELGRTHEKEIVVYISMGFGNPYGDEWNTDLVKKWVDALAGYGIVTFSLADTVGLADVGSIRTLFTDLTAEYPELEFGAHFHAAPSRWRDKVAAAYDAGCRRFDGALLGYGGCPMAQDELVGNMATENLVRFAREKGVPLVLNDEALERSRQLFSGMVAGI